MAASTTTNTGLPAWMRGMRNLEREHGFEALRTDGKLPDDLDGTLYRNVPAIFDQYGERVQHWFDPETAVAACRIRGGKAEAAVKLIEIPGMVRERRVKKRSYARFGTPIVSFFREVLMNERRNPAGTSILCWNDRLFATSEAGQPVELDPESLATKGVSDLEGTILHFFGAHPHAVSERKALYNIGIQMTRNTTVTVYELPFGGAARRLTQVTIPGAVMLHDFMVTRNHIIIPVPAFRIDMLPIVLRRKAVADCAQWRPELGTELIVIPIDAPEKVTRFTVDPHHVEHVVNAYEDKGSIVFDAIWYPTVGGRDGYIRGLVHGRVDAPLEANVSRGVIDPAAKKCTYETRYDRACEFPRMSPRFEARRHRYGYVAGFSSEEAERTTFFDALVKVDLEGGTHQKWIPPAGHFPGEPIFAPSREQTSEAEAEDAGYVLSLVLDAKNDESYVAVLDARKLSEGPVARILFGQVIPFGFHGAWTESFDSK